MPKKKMVSVGGYMYDPPQRLSRIKELLRVGPYGSEELAGVLKITSRQVRRDLGVLVKQGLIKRSGHKYVLTDGRKSGGLTKVAKKPLSAKEKAEKLAAVSAEEFSELGSAIEALAPLNLSYVMNLLNDIRNAYTVRDSKLKKELGKQKKNMQLASFLPSGVNPLFITMLNDAIEHRRCLKMQYTDRNAAVTTRIIAPFKMSVAENGQVYLYAWRDGGTSKSTSQRAEHNLRTFLVCNIQDLRASERTFVEIDADVIEKYLHDQYSAFPSKHFARITVEVDTKLKGYISTSKLHPKQKVVAHGDIVTVSFDAGINSSLVSAITKLGTFAYVLTPPELRLEVMANLEATLKHYKKKSPKK